MKLLLAILPTVIFTLYSQVVTKWRVGALGATVADLPLRAKIMSYLMDPLIVSSYAVMFVASASWFLVLEKYELSLAYPTFIGIMFFFATFAGIVFFGETVTTTKILGIILILAGISVAAI